MADRVEVFDVTVAAGTTKTAPAVSPLGFDPGYLRRWAVTIPDGVSALAGFQLAYDGQPVIPNTRGAWITGNGEPISDDAGYDFVGNRWSLVGYNLDIYDHTFHVRLFVDEIGSREVTSAVAPEVLPVTINTGTVDLTPISDAPVDLALGSAPVFTDGVTPLDIPVDTVAVDTADTVTPLDLPTDAPVVADTPADTPTEESA